MTRDPLTVVKVTQDAALGVPEGRPARAADGLRAQLPALVPTEVRSVPAALGL